MKKKHAVGSLDPTKLVVGIGILAVIAVAAGLLSTGVGSFQGSVARRNIPGLLLRLSGTSPQGTIISGGAARNNVIVGKWLLIPNPAEERFTVRAIGFDLDNKNRNQLIPRIFGQGATIMRNIDTRQNTQVASVVLSDAHFDGNCEMVPVEPFEVTGAKTELRLVVNSIDPILLSEFAPVLCVEGTIPSTVGGKLLIIEGPNPVLVASSTPPLPPSATIETGAQQVVVGKWTVSPELARDAQISNIRFGLGFSPERNLPPPYDYFVDSAQLITEDGIVIFATTSIYGRFLTDGSTCGNYNDPNMAPWGPLLNPFTIPANGTEISLVLNTRDRQNIPGEPQNIFSDPTLCIINTIGGRRVPSWAYANTP